MINLNNLINIIFKIDTELNNAPDWAVPHYLTKPKTTVRKRRPLVGNAKSM